MKAQAHKGPEFRYPKLEALTNEDIYTWMLTCHDPINVLTARRALKGDPCARRAIEWLVATDGEMLI